MMLEFLRHPYRAVYLDEPANPQPYTQHSTAQGRACKQRSTGSNTKTSAVIEEPTVVECILTHIGLSAQPPPERVGAV
jgi:hypothetical protein